MNTSELNGLLRCPACDHDHVHVDDAFVAGRPREDGEVFSVHVDHGGKVRSDRSISVPPPADGVGQRHHIAVAGWCENCTERFAVVFKQHKGQTLVSTVVQRWSPHA